jgi:hypothetical protein
MAHRGYKARLHGALTGVKWLLPMLFAAVVSLCLPLLASGCSASTPERAVRDFVSARVAGDDEGAAELTIEGDLTDYMGGEPSLYATGVSYDLEQAEVEGDRAVVIVYFRWDEEYVEIPYVSRREGTRWKVALRETEELWLPESDLYEAPFGP